MSRHVTTLRRMAAQAKIREMIPDAFPKTGGRSSGQKPERDLVEIKCELRVRNAKGTSIAIWLGEYDGEKPDPKTGELRPWEKWQWLPVKHTTETATGVAIPKWLAKKEELMSAESSSESGQESA